MNITENKRDQSLDIMKGIGILLVVFAHVFHHNGIIYQFHMPLFFILSGAAMTYSSKGYSFQKKVKTLLIPYFVFSVIWFCYWAFLESKFRPITGGEIFGNLSNGNMKIQQFINIFTAINSKSAFVYNIVLWFLPCLFMAEFIFAKVVGGKKELLADIITVIACYLFVQNSDGLPWCFGEALVAVPLLSLGFHIYPPLIKFLSKNIVRTIVIGIACIMLLVILYARLEPHTDMAHNIISNEFYLMAIIGSLVVVTLSLLINLKSIRGGVLHSIFR